MKFNYQARTKKGEVHTGNVEASSREAAISLLQKHGFYVTFLEEAVLPVYAKRIKLFEKISKKELVLFSRQLSIMFKSKVPLVESLRVLSTQAKNSDFREIILKLSEEVESGTAFSKAVSSYPKVFSSFYVAMVKAGEAAGSLSKSLTYLADHLEREYHLKAKTKGALLYPCLIIFVIAVVLTLLIFFIIPQLVTVLETSGEPLPLLTKLVIGFSDFLRKWGWTILLAIILLIISCFRWYRTAKGKKSFDGIFLHLPIIGSLLKMVYLSRFAENLSTLISGGLPIAKALEITGEIIGNTRYKEIIFETRDEVRRGEPISSVLGRGLELFSPVFIQMILVGEKTGTLDTTLMNIVDFYQKEVDREIENTLSILEPALIVFLGVVVAGLMLAILMPLYKIVSF